MTFFSKLKNYDSLTDPPIFMGFVIDEASGRGRPMIDRLFDDKHIMDLAGRRPLFGRRLANDRQTDGRWHFIKETLADGHRISADDD